MDELTVMYGFSSLM